MTASAQRAHHTTPGISVLYSVAALLTKLGGPVRSVPFLAEAVAREGHRAALVSQRPKGSPDGASLLPDPELVPTLMAEGYESTRLRTVLSLSHRSTVQQAIDRFKPSLIHDNGLWLPANHNVAVIANNANIRRVVSPRGALDAWSLGQSGRLKRMAMALYQRRDLQSAAAFMVTSEEEAESVRRAGFNQPVAVVPNGVYVPSLTSLTESRTRAASDKLTALFLSRIHPKKGVELLLDAWKSISPRNWRLLIVGPSDPQYLSALRRRAAESPGNSDITFLPEASESEKAAIYGQADLFVLPSHQENFGIVIAEAMSFGIPVVTTTATPWKHLENTGAGWCVPLNFADFAQAMRDALSQPENELRRRGMLGRAMIERDYGWAQAGAKAVHFYSWLLAPQSCERPDHVH